jgi:hypothetical protein
MCHAVNTRRLPASRRLAAPSLAVNTCSQAGANLAVYTSGKWAIEGERAGAAPVCLAERMGDQSQIAAVV